MSNSNVFVFNEEGREGLVSAYSLYNGEEMVSLSELNDILLLKASTGLRKNTKNELIP